MAVFDIIVIVIVGAFLVNGVRKGFFGEVLGLVGIVGGVIAGIIGSGPLSAWAADNLIEGSEVPMLIGSFFVIFVGFYFLSRALASLLKSMLENLFLGWLDRLAGGILALLKSAMVLGLIVAFLSFIPFDSLLDPIREDSYFYEPLSDMVPWMYEVMGSPEELPERVQEIFEKGKEEFIDETLDEVREEVEDAINNTF